MQKFCTIIWVSGQNSSRKKICARLREYARVLREYAPVLRVLRGPGNCENQKSEPKNRFCSGLPAPAIKSQTARQSQNRGGGCCGFATWDSTVNRASELWPAGLRGLLSCVTTDPKSKAVRLRSERGGVTAPREATSGQI